VKKTILSGIVVIIIVTLLSDVKHHEVLVYFFKQTALLHQDLDQFGQFLFTIYCVTFHKVKDAHPRHLNPPIS